LITVTARRRTINQLRVFMSISYRKVTDYAIIFFVSVKENIAAIRERIARAASALGRNPQEIKLVAVTKTVAIELVEEAIRAGITDIGENRVREAGPKIEALRQKYPRVTWHMIGHLQRNKVRQALELFDMIQSVDSERLAREIQAKAEAQGLRPKVLIEVNTSGEESKYGVPVDEAVKLLKIISTFANIDVQGLMTMAPLADDPEAARPYFKKLKSLSKEINKLNLPNLEIKYLSMGMTDDFETAIQEGSNMVRIGRAIFKGVH
jgi:pyridoxal phosphate enzyme (YggS family)